MINRTFQISLWLLYLLVLLILLSSAINSPPSNSSTPTLSNPNLQQIRNLNIKTADTLLQLVKTKFFKILRLNINSQCQLPYFNRICKSKSCAVCRCDEKDIPQNWMRTDRVVPENPETKGKDIWGDERQKTSNEWVWHVEDEENDKGEYFDVNFNIESFSGYNGSYIWELIYEQNCFKGKHNYQQMCREERLLYQIISGLHTSISTHLSRFYRNITEKPEWADVSSDQSFFFNHQSYKQRVLSHPDRLQNLLFLYELLIKSVREAIPFLSNLTIVSDNIGEDLKSSQLLKQFIHEVELGGVGLGSLEQTNYGMFSYNKTANKGYLKNYLEDHHVKQYQRYIHNISRILNCVECEKCRLFGKMQTYGLGTAMKILLGYDQQLKRNELVAMINTLNKVSISVNTYLEYENKFNPIKSENKGDRYIFVKIWGFCGLTFLLFLWVASKWQGNKTISKKIEKSFKNSQKFKNL